MRRGSKQRRAARVKRRRKQLAALIGSHEAVAVLAGECSVREACSGLDTNERARARELVEQLQAEAGR
jgi:hypothetical protein